MRIDFQAGTRGIQALFYSTWPVLTAILVGAVLGAMAIALGGASNKWTLILLISVAAPSAILVVRDIRKLLLIACVVDIPLGLDIALQDQEWHQGGPTGYMISLMTVVIVVGYALWIVDRKPRPRLFPDITLPALLYLFMVVVSLSQAQNLQLALFGVFLQLEFFLMYFYLANHVVTWDDVRVVMVTVIVLLLFEAALMVVQYFAGTSVTVGAIMSYSYDGTASAGATGPRVGGTIGSANSAAAYLAPMLLLTFAAYLSRSRHPSDRDLVDLWLIVPAGALGIVALIATASRTAWGSLTLSTSLLMTQVILTPARTRALAILLIAGLVVGIFFGGQVVERLSTASADTTRPELAYMAHNIIRAYPLGVGENNYDQVMSDRYAHPNWIGHTLLPVHNKYLLVWVDTGLQGLIAFVLMLFAAAWLGLRRLFTRNLSARTRVLLAGFLCALCGYAFHMNTEGFSSRANVQLLWFLMAMIAALGTIAVQESNAESGVSAVGLQGR